MARKERAGIVANPLHAVLFFSMFIIGTAVLTFAKAFLNDGHGYFVIAASFILMMFYGVLVTLVPLTKLRLDVAADNLYYLGFLYTLSSLAVALINNFEPERILANFGVAISSTLIGICARVSLNQLRVDPHEVEEASRVELAEATRRVRRELDATILHLTDFRRASLQSMSEGFEETQKNIDEISESILKSVDDASQETVRTTASMIAKSNEANLSILESLKQVNESTETLLKINKGLTKDIDDFSKSLQGLAVHYSNVEGIQEKIAEAFNEKIEGVRKGIVDEINDVLKSVIKEFEAVKAVASKSDQRSNELNAGLDALVTQIDEKFLSLKKEIVGQIDALPEPEQMLRSVTAHTAAQMSSLREEIQKSLGEVRTEIMSQAEKLNAAQTEVSANDTASTDSPNPDRKAPPPLNVDVSMAAFKKSYQKNMAAKTAALPPEAVRALAEAEQQNKNKSKPQNIKIKPAGDSKP